jgi:NTE family protein
VNARSNKPRNVNLALQGGGAHGAFAWGVLDYLLEDGRIHFEGVSATSAGAMNAAVLAQGLVAGGNDGAREALHEFWHDIAKTSEKYSPYKGMPWDKLMGNHTLDQSPMFMMMEFATRIFSPYQLNPMNLNPLKDVLLRHVDFDLLKSTSKVKLYISATNVETGKVKVFKNHDMCPEAILASACLPFIFQAVEVDGQHYWDGGYMGNPSIFPIIYDCESQDIVIVHINPIIRKGVPTTASDIMNRINEISFNSSLMREMRAIAFVTTLIENKRVQDNHLKQMLVHSIRSDETMTELGVSSKLNADWDFLCFLKDKGRAEAESWLEKNYDALGKHSSVDLKAEFL